jgi:hypothetical protein
MNIRTPADLLINDGMSTGRHYTVQEIAKMWKLSETMVRDLFREEPGVLRAERPLTRFKRGYTTIRVPETVLRRVHARMMFRPAA